MGENEFKGPILIADDAPLQRRMLKSTLGKLGFSNVLEASDGTEALEVLKGFAQGAVTQGAPQFLLIDQKMPGIDGLALLHKVRSLKGWETVPFIFITAESNMDSMVEATLSGADGYLLKPVDGPSLKLKIQEVWKQHQEKMLGREKAG